MLSRIILVMCLFSGCCKYSLPIKKEYLSRKENGTYGISVPYRNLAYIKYNKTTTPATVCLRELYSHKVYDVKIHCEHTLLAEYWHRHFDASLERMQKLSDNEIEAFLAEWFKPLFFDEFTDEMLQDALADTLKINLSQQIISPREAIVLVNKYQQYKLRRVEGFWKIYNLENLPDSALIEWENQFREK